MSDYSSEPASGVPPVLQDALEIWQNDVGSPAQTLDEFRLSSNEQFAILFTTHICPVELHYLDCLSHRGYWRCSGADCVLCQTGYSIEVRHLLPIYNPVAQAVQILAIPPSMRPKSLRAGLLTILCHIKDNHEQLVSITRGHPGQFFVLHRGKTDFSPEDSTKVLHFFDQYQKQQIDLREIYQQLPNAELLEIPEIKRRLNLRGVHQ